MLRRYDCYCGAVHAVMDEELDTCEVCGATSWKKITVSHRTLERRKGRTWPMESEAMGLINTEDLPEAHAMDRHLGVGDVDYSKEGNPIFTSASQRKRFCEAHGMFDKNGGYSDPQSK